MLVFLAKGGFIMALILVCSIVSLAVVIERFYKLRQIGIRAKKVPVDAAMVRELEQNIDILGVIAQTAPLLGLLGTVLGMIRAFMRIEELAGMANPQALAGGIWEALLTTAFGLAVAIPSFVMFHYFSRKADEYALAAEAERAV